MESHLEILKQGVDFWNNWRKKNPGVRPDLSPVDLHEANLSAADLHETDLRVANLREANLSAANLSKANLIMANLIRADVSKAILRGAILEGATLIKANLTAADLRGAKLSPADLRGANLSGADLRGANLGGADLIQADLSGADLAGVNFSGINLTTANLSGANLRGANLGGAYLKEADLVGANFNGAQLVNCQIYGISTWNVNLENATQFNLIITPPGEPAITVDNLEVAQFIYLLLNNKEIRDVIDTITSKVVLILGSFARNRKVVLDAIRNELRRRNYLPVLFDFEKPASRDITETVSILAHMARFVIADITGARSIREELDHIVPGLPSVPVQPLLQTSAKKYAMFEHAKRYPWVLQIYRYRSIEELLASLQKKVITPAEDKVNELRKG